MAKKKTSTQNQSNTADLYREPTVTKDNVVAKGDGPEREVGVKLPDSEEGNQLYGAVLKAVHCPACAQREGEPCRDMRLSAPFDKYPPEFEDEDRFTTVHAERLSFWAHKRWEAGEDIQPLDLEEGFVVGIPPKGDARSYRWLVDAGDASAERLDVDLERAAVFEQDEARAAAKAIKGAKVYTVEQARMFWEEGKAVAAIVKLPKPDEPKAPNGSKAVMVFDVAKALGGPLRRETGWLYFLDKNCNVARSRMVSAAGKGKGKNREAEVIIETDVSREEGWLYFIGKDGNVWRTELQRKGHAPHLVDEEGRVLFERELPVPLTDEELKERGQELAEKMREVDQAEQAKKDAAAHHKQIVERLTAEASDMARVIRAGKVERSVKCYTEHDLEKEVARVVRCDTGEVVETRTLSRDELNDLRQGKLFKEPAPAAEGEGEGEGEGEEEGEGEGVEPEALEAAAEDGAPAEAVAP